jgi:hypothetical protein
MAWITAAQSGHPRKRLTRWREQGQLEPGTDYKTVRRTIPRPGIRGPLQTRRVRVYRAAALARLAKSRSHVPTVGEVEKSKQWVSAGNNPFGIPRPVIYYWRQNCPYVRGRKLKVKCVRCVVNDLGASRVVSFFLRSQLAAIAPSFHKQEMGHTTRRAQGCTLTAKATWAAKEVLVDAEGEWWRTQKAVEFLDISQPLLSSWTRLGCPYKDGRARLRSRVQAVRGVKSRYYLASELRAIKDRRDATPATPVRVGEIDLAEAVRRTGYSAMWFKIEENRRELGITTIRRQSLDKRGNLSRPRPVFLESEIDALSKWLGPGPITRAKLKAIRTNGEATAKTPPRRTPPKPPEKPQRPIHLKWKAWKDSGLSYGQIVDREAAETGDVYSREAVISGIKRL